MAISRWHAPSCAEPVCPATPNRTDAAAAALLARHSARVQAIAERLAFMEELSPAEISALLDSL